MMVLDLIDLIYYRERDEILCNIRYGSLRISLFIETIYDNSVMTFFPEYHTLMNIVTTSK